MMSEDSGAVHGGTSGGVAGEHRDVAPFQLLVSTATSNETNTAHLRLIPIGCWRVDDIRFAFDSSFVTSDITAELELLVNLRETKKKLNISGKKQYPPLSVFGHADPVGTDDYNKALSGRRATAIYGLLISRTQPERACALWQQVAHTEEWGMDQRQAMQTKTSLPSCTSDHDLVAAYMQKLCPPELQLDLTDFLAQGADGTGKGDYQGCSEFNPLLIFSQKQQTHFEQSGDKKVRNLNNAQNRRVTVLLFRPGSKVLPSKWPCPRATEAKAGCITRFWSGGDNRRSMKLPTQPRRFQDTQDTFACRFYQRLSAGSPCDQVQSKIRIRLLDAFSLPIPNAPYQLQLSHSTRKGKADSQGWFEEVVSSIPNTCQVDWGYPDAEEDSPRDLGTAPRIPLASIYHLDVLLQSLGTVASSANSNQSLSNKLSNLGYGWAETLRENVMAFQQDHHRPEGLTGDPADVHKVVSQWHDTGEANAIALSRSITLYGKFPDDEIS